MTKPERRRFPRIGEAVTITYRAAGQIGTTWHPATVVNFGAGGVRLRVEEPLERLATLALQIVFPGARKTLELQAQVIWVQMASPTVNECGVEFLELTPPQQAIIDELVGFLRNQV